MAKKITQLTPKGAILAATDLLEIAQDAGAGAYVSRSVTGAQVKDYVLLQYTEVQRDALVSPATGLLIYNTTRNRHEYYDPFWGWHPVGLTATALRDWGIEWIQEFDTTASTQFLNSVAINAGTVINQSSYSTIRMSTATNTNGGYRFNTGFTNYEFGVNPFRYEIRTRVNVNSDGTDTFQYICGFFDTSGVINQVDGAFFLYDSQGVSTGSAASGNWQLVTASNSVRTFTTSSVAIDNTNLQKLRIDVNAAGTSVQFYINDTLVGTHTTNIPTGAARQFGLGNFLQKSAGTTARTTDVDYMFFKMKFTTPR
jgi:hypothetical protein